MHNKKFEFIKGMEFLIQSYLLGLSISAIPITYEIEKEIIKSKSQHEINKKEFLDLYYYISKCYYEERSINN